MTGELRISVHAASDVGLVREGNEDSLFAGATVYAVADGMGHKAGEIASETALGPIAELDGDSFAEPAAASESLRQAIESANRIVVQEARHNPEYTGMGTTLTAALVRDGHLHLAHVGDSRAYLLRDGEPMTQLTTDHTLVEQLVQEGRLSRDEVGTHPQRSVVTRAIGVDAEVEVDMLPPLVLQPGDQVVLCSDGLTGPVADEEIADILAATPDGDQAVRDLLSLANDRGGPDNITVILLRVSEGEPGRGAVAGGAFAAPSSRASGRRPATPGTGAARAPGEGRAQGAVREEATIALGRIGTPRPASPVTSIRTRPESEGHDWATDFSRYAQRAPGEAAADRRGRGRRVLAFLTSAVVLLAVLAVGGWLLLSRAFFIGEADGNVAIYNGLPQEVAGVALYRLRETTDLPLTALPDLRAQRVRETITAADMAEAQAIVAGYRAEVEAPNPAATPSPTPQPSASEPATG